MSSFTVIKIPQVRGKSTVKLIPPGKVVVLVLTQPSFCPCRHLLTSHSRDEQRVVRCHHCECKDYGGKV